MTANTIHPPAELGDIEIQQLRRRLAGEPVDAAPTMPAEAAARLRHEARRLLARLRRVSPAQVIALDAAHADAALALEAAGDIDILDRPHPRLIRVRLARGGVL